MKAPSNLPPGVTDYDIEKAAGAFDSLEAAEQSVATEDCLKHQFGFACCGPFVATRIAPGEYVIQGDNGIQFRVEGAAFAEWVARALTEYDKCLDVIEIHLDDCFGCEKDTPGDEGMKPCANCDALEERMLVRHNAEVEANRLSR